MNFCVLDLEIKEKGKKTALLIQSIWMHKIQNAQEKDPGLRTITDSKEGGHKPFITLKNGLLHFRDRVIIPDFQGLRNEILKEAHSTKFAIHLGYMKMYRDLMKHFWWLGFKKDIKKFVRQCQIY